MPSLPNILFIMSDQQRPDSLGCYGNCFIDSPNLDTLAAGGAVFDNAFTVFPLCTPARATIWTGLYPHVNDITDCCFEIDDCFAWGDYPMTVFSRLKAAGYQIGYFGKWHLGGARPDGVDTWKAFNSGGGHWVDGLQSFQGGTYLPAVQTDDMIEELDRISTEEAPFFMVQSYYPPHEPYTTEKRYMDRYRGKGIFRPGYYAAVTALDDCVGRILEALERNDLTRDTLVIYTSDHGEHFNYRAKLNKTTGHDDSIRIPMMMSWPGRIDAGRRFDEPVGLQDITPTLLDLAGAEAPELSHGESLLPSVFGQGRVQRTQYYVQNVEDFRTIDDWYALTNGKVYLPSSRNYRSETGEWDRQRALWTPELKLVLSEEGRHLLYDLRVDPEEELNLFGAPKFDYYNQYQHIPDPTPTCRQLTHRLRDEALALKDTFGVELADRVLNELAG
jgi:choline-sulfatase